MPVLIYDYKRDGDIKPSETVLVCEDGTSEKIAETNLHPVAEKAKLPVCDTKNSWGEVIQYLDGYAWGVAADGSTICLGVESAIKEAIANPKLKSGDPVIDQIIELERELQIKGELEYGRTRDVQVRSSRSQRAIRTGGVGVRLTPHLEYKPVNTRHLKARQRLPGSEA